MGKLGAMAVDVAEPHLKGCQKYKDFINNKTAKCMSFLKEIEIGPSRSQSMP